MGAAGALPTGPRGDVSGRPVRGQAEGKRIERVALDGPVQCGASSSVRVLTVDDQAVFRGAARDVIDATPGFESVGEAASGHEAFAAVERLVPHLVLCDVRMPGLDGIEVARRLHSTHPGMLVVLISIEESVDLPSALRLKDIAPLVRKQDFRPALLRRLWREHGP
jgi:two-component system invasion response regulator UvrY